MNSAPAALPMQQSLTTEKLITAPKFTFPDTDAEQEKQLEQNPLLKRFADSRRNRAENRYLPAYHYTCPEGKLHDPNGLCFWQGRWHLFYQARPPESETGWDWGPWGHVVSDDLVHWRDLPYAIYPGPENSCYSGGTLVEGNRVIAMYHGRGLGNMVAVSSDPLLLNWEKLTDTAVIPNHSRTEPPAFNCVYDPNIWKSGTTYYSISGHGARGRGQRRHRRTHVLFRSMDLIHWECLHEFVENDFHTMVGDDGACPNFWPIGEKYIMLFFSHMSGSQYLLGDYDTERQKFVVTDGAKLTFGPWGPGGIHAPMAVPDGQGGLIAMFNINSYVSLGGGHELMSLPRRLTLDSTTPEHPLRMEPTGNIESLRGDHHRIDRMLLPANEEVVLNGIRGDALEIDAVVEPTDSPMIEMNVLRSPDAQERTRIMFYRDRGYVSRSESLISIDTSYSSLLPEAKSRAPETAPIYMENDEPLHLQVFVDRSVVEVFVNGKQCVAVRVYPGRDDSVGISLRSQGKDAILKSLDVWRMGVFF